MISSSAKESNMLQLKKIINSVYSDDILLSVIKKFEKQNKFQGLELLKRIQELIPLAKSVSAVKHSITAFTRRLLSLLDERNVLDNQELSQEILKCLKTFWSICSSKQSALSSPKLLGRWDATLIEEATALASIFIDLFIAANGTKENQAVWSKRLFSWLNFDLPDRAIKVALLEVTGQNRKEAEIAGPLVSHVLQRKFDYDSCPDYLLQFLVFKKWQHLTDVAPMEKTCKSLIAPSQFLSWLKTFWEPVADYVPTDKSLKGSMISQFLLDLDTSDVFDSLTDALNAAIFPDNVENGAAQGDVFSEAPVFVVDKQGYDADQGQDSSLKVNAKRKRTSDVSVNDDRVDGPVNLDDQGVSHRKKKQRMDSNRDDNDMPTVRGLVLDRGSRGPEQNVNHIVVGDVNGVGDSEDSSSDEESETVQEEEGSSEEEQEDEAKEENSDDDDVDDDDDTSEDEEEDRPPQKKLKKDFNLSQKEKSVAKEVSESEESEAVVEMAQEEESSSLATAVLKRRNILISDPVASSYFQNAGDSQRAGKEKEIIKTIVENSDSHDTDCSQESEPEIHARTRSKDNRKEASPKKSSSPTKLKESSENRIGSPKKPGKTPKMIRSPVKIISSKNKENEHVKEISKSIMSHIDPFSFHGTDSEEAEGREQVTCSVFHATVDKTPNINVPMETVIDSEITSDKRSLTDDIATKLSALRKSTPSKSRSLQKEQAETPSRRSTRIRVGTDKEEGTPSKRSSLVNSSLKDWLRPLEKVAKTPKSSDASLEVKQKTNTPGKRMTKIKDHHVSDEEVSEKVSESDSTANNSQTKDSKSPQKSPKKETKREDVFPSPVKTYSRRNRNLSEKMLSEETPTKVRSSGSPRKAKAILNENSDGEEEKGHVLSNLHKNDTPNISQSITPAKKASAKKTKARNQSEESVDKEEADTKSAKKTPGRKSTNQLAKTPKSEDTTGNSKSKASPSPGNRRRKSLRSAKQKVSED